jgi:hypothetical protein
MPRNKPARNRLGPSNHNNPDDDEDDRHHDRAGGGEGRRRGCRGGGRDDDGRVDDGCDARDDGGGHMCDNGRQQQRHKQRPSCSPDHRRHGKDVVLEGSRRCSKSPPRATRGFDHDIVPEPIRASATPEVVHAATAQLLRGMDQRRRSQSRTPTGYMAMDLTPSPPSGQPYSPGSLMQLSPPPSGH